MVEIEFIEAGDGPRCTGCGSLKWNGHFANCPSHEPAPKIDANARIAELEAELADCDKAWRACGNRAENAEKKVRELEAQLADSRDLAYNRAPKIAAEECNRQKDELTELVRKLNGDLSVADATIGDIKAQMAEWKTAAAAENTKLLRQREQAEARLAAIDDALDDADAPDATESHALHNDPIIERIKLWKYVQDEISARLAAAEAEAERAGRDFQVARDAFDKSEADAVRLRAALKKVEWLASGAHFYCPQCHNIKSLGHHRNCIYRAEQPAESEGKE